MLDCLFRRILLLIPGDPVDNLLRIASAPEARAKIGAKYGLDRPLTVQNALWLGSVLQGDLGRSFITRRPMAAMIAQVLPNALTLGGLALLLSTVVGIFLVVAFRDRWPDQAIMGVFVGVHDAVILVGSVTDPGLCGAVGLLSGVGRAGVAAGPAAGADHRAGRHRAGDAGRNDRHGGSRFRDAAARQGPVAHDDPSAPHPAPHPDSGRHHSGAAHRLGLGGGDV